MTPVAVIRPSLPAADIRAPYPCRSMVDGSLILCEDPLITVHVIVAEDVEALRASCDLALVEVTPGRMAQLQAALGGRPTWDEAEYALALLERWTYQDIGDAPKEHR